MIEHDARAQPELLPRQRAAIEEAVKETAWEHLRSKDAETALGFYEPDATVASDGDLYASFEAFAQQARVFYRTLRDIHVAVWDEMHVDVLSPDAAVLTATVRWSSTDTTGVRTDLQGVWTAVFVRRGARWRIRARHESFARQADEL
jgi:uncharacterized protein (TIGR02246 family)